MSLQDVIVVDFQTESKSLIDQMIEILETCESDFTKVKNLEQYGQIVDRIMGAAQSIAMEVKDQAFLKNIGDYAALCKMVGYKASQIKSNPQFYDVCVALLFDATAMRNSMVDGKEGVFEWLRALW